MEILRRLYRDDEGQGLVEYAMLLGIVAIGVALALDSLGDSIQIIFNQINAGLQALPWD